MLGLDRHEPRYRLYDIWNGREFPLNEGELKVTLAGDDVLFLRHNRV
jgi:hypothetical protein